MQIIKSELYKKYHELIFGFSTKIGLNRPAPFYFNLSFTVGDDETIVKENREAFYNELGLTTNAVATQRQIHSDIVNIVDKSGIAGESDALITNKKGLGLAISSADCTPIFIYDKYNSVIAGVHSGWRGTQKKILEKTLTTLEANFGSKAEDLIVFIGPSISQKKYEIGKEVAEVFDKKYIAQIDGCTCLDVAQVNKDILINFGVIEKNIEVSSLCSFEEKDLLHSYRRDGIDSGRALGLIAIKG